MKKGQKVICNGCVGEIVEHLRDNLYLVNFGQAGNFRLFSHEFCPTMLAPDKGQAAVNSSNSVGSAPCG